MPTLALELTDKRSICLPADLAREAGLEEGEVEIVLGEHRLTVMLPLEQAGYAARRQAMAAGLRERAEPFGLPAGDRRDDSYWRIVRPLFEEVERTTGSV